MKNAFHDNADGVGSGPGDLSRKFRERERETASLKSGLTVGTTIHPYDSFGKKRNAGMTRKNAHLFGTGLFGDPIEQRAAGMLASKFLVPPFSILDSRSGPWQQRKRAWLRLGIKSELGRGENLLKMSEQALTGYKPKRTYNDKDWVKSKGLKGLAQDTHDGGMKKKSLGARPVNKETIPNWYPKKKAGMTDDEIIAEYLASESQLAGGTSIFDPVLCELAYRWFCPLGGQVVDPFAGGSVRGIVAAALGYQYWGCDLSTDQIAANEAQRPPFCTLGNPTWVSGDSRKEVREAPNADLIFTCPPYGDLEVYSDDPDDISTMTYDEFLAAYRKILLRSCKRLRDNRFVCLVIGDFRDKKSGLMRGFVGDTVEIMRGIGLGFYNDAVLVTSVGSLPIRVRKQFEGSRKLGRTHQNFLTFVKGDPKKAVEEINE